MSDREKVLHVYVRVSTDGQVQKGQSPIDQKEAAEEYAKSKGLSLEIFEDEGKSAYAKDLSERHELNRLLNKIKQREVKYMWVWNYDRLARESIIPVLINYEILNSGSTDLELYIHDSSNTIKYNSPESLIMGSLVSYQTSRQSLDLKAKLRRGRNSYFRKGGWPTRPPYGYDKDDEGYLSINEEEASTVRLIYSLKIEQSYGYGSICNELNKLGIPPKDTVTRTLHAGKSGRLVDGKTTIEWKKATVRNILVQKLYIGIREIVNTQWEKVDGVNKKVKSEIIDTIEFPNLRILKDEVFYQAQGLRSQNKAIKQPQKYNSLLNGMIECGACGNRFRTHIKPLQRRYQYSCTKNKSIYKDKEVRCHDAGINITMLNDMVMNSILDYVPFEELLSKAPESTSTKKDFTNLKKRLETSKKDLLGLDTKRNKLKSLYIDMEDMDAIEYRDRKGKLDTIESKIKSEIQSIKKNIKALESEFDYPKSSNEVLKELKSNSEKIESMYKSIRLTYDDLNSIELNYLKQLVSVLIEKVIYRRDKLTNSHEVKVIFYESDTIMERYNRITFDLNSWKGSKMENVELNEFEIKNVNKPNPIENRGMVTDNWPEENNILSKRAKESGILVMEPTPGEVIVPEFDWNEALKGHTEAFSLPVFTVTYKYELAKHYRKVLKTVYYN